MMRVLAHSNWGIKTDMLAIEKYVEEVIENIMENQSAFIENLLDPVR